jgi:hypothetical protein
VTSSFSIVGIERAGALAAVLEHQPGRAVDAVLLAEGGLRCRALVSQFGLFSAGCP